jgi:hypothetical protein
LNDTIWIDRFQVVQFLAFDWTWSKRRSLVSRSKELKRVIVVIRL